jgi:hypothetical protein
MSTFDLGCEALVQYWYFKSTKKEKLQDFLPSDLQQESKTTTE